LSKKKRWDLKNSKTKPRKLGSGKRLVQKKQVEGKQKAKRVEKKPNGAHELKVVTGLTSRGRRGTKPMSPGSGLFRKARSEVMDNRRIKRDAGEKRKAQPKSSRAQNRGPQSRGVTKKSKNTRVKKMKPRYPRKRARGRSRVKRHASE